MLLSSFIVTWRKIVLPQPASSAPEVPSAWKHNRTKAVEELHHARSASSSSTWCMKMSLSMGGAMNSRSFSEWATFWTSIVGDRCCSNASLQCRTCSQCGLFCCSALHHRQHFTCGCVTLTTQRLARPHRFHIWQCLSTLQGQRWEKKKQSPFPWEDMACAARICQHVPVTGAVGQIACCQHHWDIARTMFQVLGSLPASASHIQVAVSCALQLAKVGFDSPDWRTLLMICADTRLILTRRTQACPTMAGSFSLLRLATERERAYISSAGCLTLRVVEWCLAKSVCARSQHKTNLGRRRIQKEVPIIFAMPLCAWARESELVVEGLLLGTRSCRLWGTR